MSCLTEGSCHRTLSSEEQHPPHRVRGVGAAGEEAPTIPSEKEHQQSVLSRILKEMKIAAFSVPSTNGSHYDSTLIAFPFIITRLSGQVRGCSWTVRNSGTGRTLTLPKGTSLGVLGWWSAQWLQLFDKAHIVT